MLIQIVITDKFSDLIHTSPFKLLLYSRMGYETGRFQGEVDEELICPICSAVLEVLLYPSLAFARF